ncbi:MAG: Holliday junction resolvase RuvX [Micromonosporaceae bacterium]|nr:Holliday junction resolvase RuvX [Micromonosporaceae bacterium]
MRNPRWTRGVRIAVDVGTVRIGLAKCDPDGILATPLRTVARAKSGAKAPDSPADLAEIAAAVAEHEAVEVVVGLPVALGGQERQAASEARQYADRLARIVAPVPVRMVDERMSTVVATRRLSERGVRGKRGRAVVDQAAAVEILQGWLDTHRRVSDA